MQLTFPGRDALTLDRPCMVGVLNVTPDSFSDGGRFEGLEAAVAQGLALAQQGAAIIEVGGESTRPGAQRVDEKEQLARVVPVVRALRGALDARQAGAVICVDTTLAAVAEAAIDAGAQMLNDISAGRDDARIFEVAAKQELPLVLMHMQGEPATMQEDPQYRDVVAEVEAFLVERAEAAAAAGVATSQIVIDPGLGFGKTIEHNLALLANLRRFVATGYAVMLGASRKGFIAKLSPATRGEASERVGGTCATTTLGVMAGVHLFRVHDVQPNLQAADVARAVKTGAAGSDFSR